MKFLLSAALLSLTLGLHAQVAEMIQAKPAELKALARRTLVVELPESNQRVIDHFSKKTAAEKTAAYEASLASYREQIEPAIRANWTFNEHIEFKTTTEIVELFRKKSPKYVALMKVVLADGGGAYGYSFGMGVPALALTRTDGESKVTNKGQLWLKEWDFQMYLVTTPTDVEAETYSPAGLKFTLTQAQKVLVWNIKSGEKKSDSFIKYVKDRTEKNCRELASKKLLIDKDGLDKSVTPDEAKESYGHDMELVDHSELDSIYVNGDAGKAVLFSLPVGTIKGSMIVVEITKLAYMKVVVDPSTNEILSSIVPGIGKTYVEGLTNADLRQLNKCK